MPHLKEKQEKKQPSNILLVQALFQDNVGIGIKS